MIIDSSYFINKLALPQVGNPEGLIAVNQFIQQYEPEFLQCALGYDLCKAFVDGIEDSLPEDRWAKLLLGETYILNGRNGEWTGFENDAKISPVANYVFYQFMDNKAVDFVLTGNVVSSTENNRTVNGMDRMVDTWNRMADLNFKLFNFLKANKSLYPEWKECSYITNKYWLRSWQHYRHDDCGYNECPNNVFRKKNSYDL